MVEEQLETWESGTETTQQDAIFQVLSDPRRRFSLQHLRGAETPITVGELTTEIAAWEARQSVVERSCGDADAIEVDLVHNHLPRMAEAGIVTYDTGGRTVALAGHGAQIQSHLEVVAND